MSIETLKRRVMGMVGRAVIEAIDASRGIMTAQISGLDGELDDGVEIFELYGLTSHPHAGAEAVVVRASGNRSHSIVIACGDRRSRPLTLAPGEVCLFDDQGQLVHLKRDGVDIISPHMVRIEAPEVTVEADAINLGGAGGAKVARIGDSVVNGVITSGSDVVKAL